MLQSDAGGDRHVEALGESGNRNAEGARAGGESLRRWTFVLVAEQQRHGAVCGQLAQELRRSIEMSCPYLEAALAEPARGLCAARMRLHLEPLVRILRHAAVRDTVGGLVRDHVHSREAQSFCRAEDGGGI